MTRKLKPEEVIAIRKLNRQGWKYAHIAERFSLRPQAVSNICRHKTWKIVE